MVSAKDSNSRSDDDNKLVSGNARETGKSVTTDLRLEDSGSCERQAAVDNQGLTYHVGGQRRRQKQSRPRDIGRRPKPLERDALLHAFTSFRIRRRNPVSYTHLRAHETGRNLVCRLLLEKKKK